MYVHVHYNINILCPKEISQTMEFSVRYFLEYYSDNFRGSKNRSSHFTKVINLVKKLQ